MPKAANAATMAVVQPKLKAELRKHVENPLAKARAKECKQCEQNSHQQDFHSSPDNPHWVTWMRCVTHADGILHPAGEECHACGAPRRKAFFVEEEFRQPEGSTGPPQKKRRMATLGELKEARKDATVNDAFMRFRKAFVQTGSMHIVGAQLGKFDCSKTKASGKQTDVHRAKEYRKGTMYPVLQFLQRQTGNVLQLSEVSEQELQYICDLVEEKYGVDVVENKLGEPVVKVDDLTSGTVRYEDRDSVIVRKRKQLEFDNKENMEARFCHLVDKLKMAQHRGASTNAMRRHFESSPGMSPTPSKLAWDAIERVASEEKMVSNLYSPDKLDSVRNVMLPLQDVLKLTPGDDEARAAQCTDLYDRTCDILEKAEDLELAAFGRIFSDFARQSALEAKACQPAAADGATGVQDRSAAMQLANTIGADLLTTVSIFLKESSYLAASIDTIFVNRCQVLAVEPPDTALDVEYVNYWKKLPMLLKWTYDLVNLLVNFIPHVTVHEARCRLNVAEWARILVEAQAERQCQGSDIRLEDLRSWSQIWREQLRLNDFAATAAPSSDPALAFVELRRLNEKLMGMPIRASLVQWTEKEVTHLLGKDDLEAFKTEAVKLQDLLPDEVKGIFSIAPADSRMWVHGLQLHQGKKVHALDIAKVLHLFKEHREAVSRVLAVGLLHAPEVNKLHEEWKMQIEAVVDAITGALQSAKEVVDSNVFCLSRAKHVWWRVRAELLGEDAQNCLAAGVPPFLLVTKIL